MENKKPNKIVNEFMEQVSPYLQNSTMFYGAAIAVGVLTLMFITWPMISEHMERSETIAQNQTSIEKSRANYDALNKEYEDRLARVKKSNSEVKTVFEEEVLPTDENLTELVRYLERKVAELNVSGKEFITLSGISFGKSVKEKDYSLVTAKLTLNSNVDNFYRFMQSLESSGMKVGVSDIKDLSPAYHAGLRDGDIITAIYKDDAEKTPAIIPSVIAEQLLGLRADETINLDISRYNEITHKWQASTLVYSSDENVEGIGATLELNDDYGRLISVDKVSAKISDEQKKVNPQKIVDFSVEISAYYLPAGK